MSFMNPTDLVEEDAADLQFPKDFLKFSPNNETMQRVQFYRQSISTNSDKVCASCRIILVEPFIECADCPVLICPECFGNGKDIGQHQNDHSYIIVQDNIQVFPGTNWIAREERLLLECIVSSGYGNWDAIARAMKTKTPQECEEHYHSCYFDGLFQKLLGLTNDVYRPIRTPFFFNMNTIDPPRADNSDIAKSMAGYRAARGDFDVSYDSSAESIIMDLDGCFYGDWPDQLRPVGETLQCALLNAYNHRLRERHRRYKLIRDHGLLIPSRTMSWYAQYVDAFDYVEQVKVSRETSGKILSFMQLTSPIGFDKLLEGMQHFTELRKYILKLYECRRNGIKTLAGGRLYFKLKNKRLAQSRGTKLNQCNQQIEELRLNLNPVEGEAEYTTTNTSPNLSNLRKKAGPLEIVGLQDYEKLSKDEIVLCSLARVLPSSYIVYKKILIGENKKIGYLRLADARRLIKIDVNKTRQIYDFLLEHKEINKPFS